MGMNPAGPRGKRPVATAGYAVRDGARVPEQLQVPGLALVLARQLAAHGKPPQLAGGRTGKRRRFRGHGARAGAAVIQDPGGGQALRADEADVRPVVLIGDRDGGEAARQPGGAPLLLDVLRIVLRAAAVDDLVPAAAQHEESVA